MGPQSHRSHHEGHVRSSSQRVRATEVLKAAPPTVPPGWQSLGGGPAGSFLRPWPAACLHCWKAGCRETAPRMRGSRLGLRGSPCSHPGRAFCPLLPPGRTHVPAEPWRECGGEGPETSMQPWPSGAGETRKGFAQPPQTSWTWEEGPELAPTPPRSPRGGGPPGHTEAT